MAPASRRASIALGLCCAVSGAQADTAAEEAEDTDAAKRAPSTGLIMGAGVVVAAVALGGGGGGSDDNQPASP